MQVDCKFSLGDRVRDTRSGVTGTVDGFAVYSDGTVGVCIVYRDANGIVQQQWRQLATVEAVS